MDSLGAKQCESTAGHPESQGALDRWHETLKSILRAFCQDYPEDSDKGILFVFFAIRDSPNESN